MKCVTSVVGHGMLKLIALTLCNLYSMHCKCSRCACICITGMVIIGLGDIGGCNLYVGQEVLSYRSSVSVSVYYPFLTVEFHVLYSLHKWSKRIMATQYDWTSKEA